MARRPSDIQYIRFYTDGSAARQAVVQETPKKQPAPKRRPRKQPVVTIDVNPVAVLGTVIVAVMLIMMVVGLVQVNEAKARMDTREAYVQQLEQENISLQDQYHNGYDLEEVEKMALALGMVPQEQVTNIYLQVQEVTQEPAPTLWASFLAFVRGLLA